MRGHTSGCSRGVTMKRVITALLLFAAGWSSQSMSPVLLELVNTEKAFAATAGKVGVRDAFLKYFAEDSILFQPAPLPATEQLRQQPPAPRPLQVLLEWEPLTGEVSEDGEFGYLTGPTLTSDLTPQKRPQRHGMYFSVWRRAGGEWKVILDGGITTPGPVAKIGKLEFRRNGGTSAQARTVAMKSGGQTVEQAEAKLAAAIADLGVTNGFRRFAAPHVKLYRNRSYPIANIEEIGKYLDRAQDIKSPQVQGSGTSAGGDLGYTYGAYGGTP